MREQILKYLFFFLSVLTLFISLEFSSGNAVYLFVSLFLFLYWQRRRFRGLIASRWVGEHPFLVFFLGAMTWSFVLEISLGGRGSGIFIFYLLYFLVCYKIFTRKSLGFLTVFYFSGLFGILLQAIFTKNLTATIALAPDIATGVLFLFLKLAATLTVFGALTALPFVLLLDKEKSL